MVEKLFESTEQIRKIGETRYGKGILRITDSAVYLYYKKVFGKPEEFTIPLEQIEKVEFTKDGLPIQIVGPGYSSWSDQSWLILDIKLRDQQGFNIFVGDLSRMPRKKAEERYEKYKKILEILNSSQ